MSDEFHSLKGTRCPFDKKKITAFQGQVEKNFMSQSLCFSAVNVRIARSEQSAGCSYWPYAEMSRSMRKQRCWDWHPTDQGSSFGFCETGF